MSELAPCEPVVEQESVPTDSNLLAQLAELQRVRRHVDALTEFLRAHHADLLGLRWDVCPWDCEVRINLRACYPQPTPADIAKRLPGEWQCRVKPKINLGEYLDWTAQRGPVRVRIENAIVLRQVTRKAHHVTF